MDLLLVKASLATTPAFVIDEKQIIENLQSLVNIKEQADCHVLYSIKALPLQLVCQLATDYLDGLSVSSLFEARLAKEILVDKGSIHITTPGLKDNEFIEVAELCSHISFNSINQYQRFLNFNRQQCSLGFRLNPKLSFADDLRYDPCRPYSKLGVELESLDEIVGNLEGLHFHNVFSHTDYLPLVKILGVLKDKLGHRLSQLKWINLGGGYLYSQIINSQPLIDQILQIKDRYGLEVYIEPGKDVIGNAGYLVSTVIDSFSSDGKKIKVLDTSVNHNPEVFEYQRKPELIEATDIGRYRCQLVGSSCLAGDVFGDYQFENLPQVGDKVVFSNVGAYSLIKANRFNGYNLPDIYWMDDKITLIKQATFNHYRQQWV